MNVSNWGSYSEKIENGIDASIIFSIRLPTFNYKTLSTLLMVSFTWFVEEVLKKVFDGIYTNFKLFNDEKYLI